VNPLTLLTGSVFLLQMGNGSDSMADLQRRVITGYRYISWFITSLFYLIGPGNATKYKISVVISLFIITVIINDLYLKNHSKKAFHHINLAETLVIAVLLIPTGGLDSPFFWYALNPVLAAAIFAKTWYSWLSTCFYLVSSSLISLYMFNPRGLSFFNLILEKTSVIFVFLLITIAMRLLSTLIRCLDQQREELQQMNLTLEQANADVKHSMEHIMSLYRLVEAFSMREDTIHVLRQMVSHADNIMDRRFSFVWLAPCKDRPDVLVSESLPPELSNPLKEYLLSKKGDCPHSQQTFSLQDFSCLLTPLSSLSRFYGYLGIYLKPAETEDSGSFNLELVNFLAELVTMVLERANYEKVSSQLMILEEQNRIANEIHDNVSQRLFSIICGLHTLKANWVNQSRDSVDYQLQLLEQSAKAVSAELRTSIYSLSTRKRGEKVFKNSIKNYLDDFSKLHGISVKFDFQGDEERLSYEQKQAIYRIIRESIGNAVKHGQCSLLESKILIHAAACELTVDDNGQGFDVDSTLRDKSNKGLGLNNIRNLTQAFKGSFELKSTFNKGTTLKIRLPLTPAANDLLREKEVV